MADANKPDPKEASTSFFRKVVKFVANPAADWAEISATPDDGLPGGYGRTELKAMIERKRRNDFVRKREFDMLRKIRREGLKPDSIRGLAGSSQLDDSEQSRAHSVIRNDDAGVKAKIDEIEQQMEGESIARRTVPSQPSRPPSFYSASTIAGAIDEPDSPPAPRGGRNDVARPPAPQRAEAAPPAAQDRAWQSTEPPPLARPGEHRASDGQVSIRGTLRFDEPVEMQVNELPHDPELDEAVISFANAEFDACERSIKALIAPGAERRQHSDTWLVLFDLYRATGQQQPFESLALDYGHCFGWSPPQWFSIPQLVAAEPPPPIQAGAHAGRGEAVGWVAPQRLEIEHVVELRAKTLQMPLPWVLDWTAVQQLEPEASSELHQLMRHWSTQALQMRWLNADALLQALAEAAPAGVRDADPVYWLLRMEVLRLANRADQFDEVAIDYCVTYEVSPPSWERAKCGVKLVDGGGLTLASRQLVTDVSTGFAESLLVDEPSGLRTAAVELSGQLVGDIGDVLGQLERQLGNATVVSVNCTRLIRMDFVASGDLLNWVLKRRDEQRLVQFNDAHRLLALFFNAMGINEHARVKVRNA